MHSVEKTGKTVDAAVFSALEELGATIEEVIVEVLEEGESGILGIGRKPARVLVTLDRLDEPAHFAANESRAKSERAAAPQAVEVPVSSASAELESADARTAYFGDDSAYLEADLSDECARIEHFLSEVLAGMDIVAELHCTPRADGLSVDIEGEDVGALIGRRGDTLNALQYLSSLVVNRGSQRHLHLSLDVAGYRKRRESALQDLAERTAGRVMKIRKEYVMEVMPASERRIIHATLQNHRGVKTVSEGVEPNRYVVVVPLKDGEQKAL